MKKLLFCLFLITLQTVFASDSCGNDIHVVARAVIVQNNHILCAYDPRLTTSAGTPVFYYLPGGHIEYQEYAADALVRELFEETGCDIEVEGFIGAFERSWLNTPQSLKCHKHEISLIFKASLQHNSHETLPTVVSKEPHKVAFAWLPLEMIHTFDLRPALLQENLQTWLHSTSDHLFKSMMHIA